MTFTSIKSALRAARKFHRAYGSKGNSYVCRSARNGFAVEVWMRGVNGFYFATLV
jgi:hypothetical protein